MLCGFLRVKPANINPGHAHARENPPGIPDLGPNDEKRLRLRSKYHQADEEGDDGLFK